MLQQILVASYLYMPMANDDIQRSRRVERRNRRVQRGMSVDVGSPECVKGIYGMGSLLVKSDVLLCRQVQFVGVVCGCGLERYTGHGGLYSMVYL